MSVRPCGNRRTRPCRMFRPLWQPNSSLSGHQQLQAETDAQVGASRTYEFKHWFEEVMLAKLCHTVLEGPLPGETTACARAMPSGLCVMRAACPTRSNALCTLRRLPMPQSTMAIKGLQLSLR